MQGVVEDNALCAILVMLQHEHHASPKDFSSGPRCRNQQLASGVVDTHRTILAQPTLLFAPAGARIPATDRNSVVVPLPLRPTRTTASPAPTCQATSRGTTQPPTGTLTKKPMT